MRDKVLEVEKASKKCKYNALRVNVKKAVIAIDARRVV
jgi:hypothetical protein